MLQFQTSGRPIEPLPLLFNQIKLPNCRRPFAQFSHGTARKLRHESRVPPSDHCLCGSAKKKSSTAVVTIHTCKVSLKFFIFKVFKSCEQKQPISSPERSQSMQLRVLAVCSLVGSVHSPRTSNDLCVFQSLKSFVEDSELEFWS